MNTKILEIFDENFNKVSEDLEYVKTFYKGKIKGKPNSI